MLKLKRNFRPYFHYNAYNKVLTRKGVNKYFYGEALGWFLVFAKQNRH